MTPQPYDWPALIVSALSLVVTVAALVAGSLISLHVFQRIRARDIQEAFDQFYSSLVERTDEDIRAIMSWPNVKNPKQRVMILWHLSVVERSFFSWRQRFADDLHARHYLELTRDRLRGDEAVRSVLMDEGFDAKFKLFMFGEALGPRKWFGGMTGDRGQSREARVVALEVSTVPASNSTVPASRNGAEC